MTFAHFFFKVVKFLYKNKKGIITQPPYFVDLCQFSGAGQAVSVCVGNWCHDTIDLFYVMILLFEFEGPISSSIEVVATNQPIINSTHSFYNNARATGGSVALTIDRRDRPLRLTHRVGWELEMSNNTSQPALFTSHSVTDIHTLHYIPVRTRSWRSRPPPSPAAAPRSARTYVNSFTTLFCSKKLN